MTKTERLWWIAECPLLWPLWVLASPLIVLGLLLWVLAMGLAELIEGIAAWWWRGTTDARTGRAE